MEIAKVRSGQRALLQVTVDIVGTACPYCLTMLDDGIKTLELDKPPKIMDVVEMVAASL